MINTFSLILICFVFILILYINFLRNEHINSSELKLYGYLLLANLIGLSLEMICYCSIRYLKKME